MFSPSLLSFLPSFLPRWRVPLACYRIFRSVLVSLYRAEVDSQSQESKFLRILENSRDIFYIVTKDTTDKVAIHRTVPSNKTPPLFFPRFPPRELKLPTNGSQAYSLETSAYNNESEAVIIAINRCSSFFGFAPIFFFSLYRNIRFNTDTREKERKAKRTKERIHRAINPLNSDIKISFPWGEKWKVSRLFGATRLRVNRFRFELLNLNSKNILPIFSKGGEDQAEKSSRALFARKRRNE